MTTAPPVLLLCALLTAWGCTPRAPRHTVAGGDPERGRAAVARYGCTACHTIAGMSSWRANVGPPLSRMAERGYIAGVLPNTPENLVRWLQQPTHFSPQVAMPDLGLTPAEAADIAAFLYANE